MCLITILDVKTNEIKLTIKTLPLHYRQRLLRRHSLVCVMFQDDATVGSP